MLRVLGLLLAEGGLPAQLFFLLEVALELFFGHLEHGLLLVLEGEEEGVLLPVEALHEERLGALQPDRVLLVWHVALFLRRGKVDDDSRERRGLEDLDEDVALRQEVLDVPGEEEQHAKDADQGGKRERDEVAALAARILA